MEDDVGAAPGTPHPTRIGGWGPNALETGGEQGAMRVHEGKVGVNEGASGKVGGDGVT